jgi:hypothetical protein
MCRARRAEAGLTEVVVRRWGGEVTRCGGVWRCPHRREGRWRLRLAPGVAGEDEGGEGDFKSGNGGGLAGLTVEGGNGDGGGRKCVGGRGSSGTGVDEMHAHLALGKGERESLAARSERRVTGVRGKIRPATRAARF